MEIRKFDKNDWSGLTTKATSLKLTDEQIRNIGKRMLPMFDWDAPLMSPPKIEYCKCCGQLIHR